MSAVRLYGPVVDEIYARFLPEKLYECLLKLKLLDGKERVYQAGEGDNKKEWRISVKPERVHLGEGPPDNIVVSIKTLIKNSYKETNLAFSNKSWYATSGITEEGFPYSMGNNKLCPIDGISDEECLEATPEIVKAVVNALVGIMKPNKELLLSFPDIEPPKSNKQRGCSII